MTPTNGSEFDNYPPRRRVGLRRASQGRWLSHLLPATFLLLASCGLTAGNDDLTDPSAPSFPASSMPSVSTPESAAGTPESSGTTSAVPPSGSTTGATLGPLVGLALEPVDVDVDFPVLVLSPPGSAETYVVDKAGLVIPVGGGEPLLDIRDRVRNGNERGLLGVAFDPEYRSNGRVFVHYSDRSGDTVVSSFVVDNATADPNNEAVFLSVSQPAANHNGGMIQFGPDGYLYIGLGDGGGSNDRYQNGQNLDSLLGAILRIDVSVSPYSIPEGNPFSGSGQRGEIWTYGVRNPWRFWIDETTGQIVIADVGQNAYEEIDIVPLETAGANLGWPVMEGLHCFDPASGCEGRAAEFFAPAVEVSHRDAGTCSVTGGVVYRGALIPELDGVYLFSDYCGGYLRGFELGNPAAVTDYTEMVGGVVGQVTSFGVDGAGEVYIALANGGVFKLVPLR